MPIRQVFESALALGHSILGGAERFDHAQEVLMVVAEFELHRSEVSKITGDRHCRFRKIALVLDQCLKTKTLQALSHRAAVPPQDLRRRLHVKILPSQRFENGAVARVIRTGKCGVCARVAEQVIKHEGLRGEDLSIDQSDSSLQYVE